MLHAKTHDLFVVGSKDIITFRSLAHFSHQVKSSGRFPEYKAREQAEGDRMAKLISNAGDHVSWSRAITISRRVYTIGNLQAASRGLIQPSESMKGPLRDQMCNDVVGKLPTTAAWQPALPDHEGRFSCMGLRAASPSGTV